MPSTPKPTCFLTARSSLTFVGGYSTLNYFDSDLLNYGTASARAGYNYQIDRKNAIGLDYTFSDTNYSNFHQSIIEHIFQVSYGRRVTGRLALQIAAGPADSDVPGSDNDGSGGTGGESTSSTTNLYWSLNANLMYALQRTTFALTYSHGVEGGSGVLAGSEADTVSGYITHQVTRRFTSGITGGYSRNQGLAAVDTTSSAQHPDIRLLVRRRQSFISPGPYHVAFISVPVAISDFRNSILHRNAMRNRCDTQHDFDGSELARSPARF